MNDDLVEIQKAMSDMNESTMRLRNALIRRLARSGISKREIAETMGMTRQRVSQIVNREGES